MNPPREDHPDHLDPSQVFSHTALSVPRTKTSSSPGPMEAAAGAAPAGITPPRLCQPDHFPPEYHLCHTLASVPRTNVSILPDPQDTAAGWETRTPPRETHPPQFPLASRAFSISVLSVPCANTCSCGAFIEEATGPEAVEPPRFSVLDHPGGQAQLRCSTVPAAVRSNTSN